MLQGTESREAELEKLLLDERKRCNEHKQYYQTLKEEHAKLRDELTLIYDQLKEATTQNEKLKSTNEANIRKLEAKVKEQQNEIVALTKKLKSCDEKKIQATVFEEATAHYESKIKELHVEADKIRDQYNNLHYENAILKCKFESREAEYSRTLERINLQHQGEVEQLKGKIEAFEKDKSLPPDNYAIELKSSKREVLQLNSKVKALLAECEELRTQNETLTLQMNSLNKTNSKEISNHISNIRLLESEKLKAITQKEILEKELVNSQEHRKVLNNELNASRREILSLKNSLEECKHKCHMMLTNAQVEMEQLKASKESELEQLLDEISRLKTELQNLNSSLVKERQSMIAKEQDLQGNLSVLRQQFWHQSRDMNQEKDKIERKMKEILTEKDDLISHLKQEILSLKQKLSICSTSKAELEKEILSLRGQLGEAAKQAEGLQTEVLPNQNLNYEKEIKDLKERINLLSSGNFGDQMSNIHVLNAKSETRSDHEIMQLKLNWEQQKLQFQQRLEELESQLRETRSSSTVEKRELEFKVKQYTKQINKLRDRLKLQKAHNEELENQREILEKNIPPEIHFQVKNQLSDLQKRLEKYHNLIAAGPNSSKNISVMPSDKLLTDIKNIHFQTLPQLAPYEQSHLLQRSKEQSVKKDFHARTLQSRRKSLKTKLKAQTSEVTSPIISSSSDSDLENL
ncbi:centrosomal protein [Trichonephila clavata]|uniref:Centrosomal protein n=1 Tax=Trichonephila clavata TaxID=2740835 RepID=A0A8X6FM70_TRICU|nr:centrosomal protein [Trichonephila clavata]